jgi:tetratricopeptide (TPR) repeat protein
MTSQTTSSNTCTSNNAERLKAEGNVLHQNRQFQAAYNKYSEAIKEDPKNAVLWANRAASALSMKKWVLWLRRARGLIICFRYLDAVSDAEKVLTPRTHLQSTNGPGFLGYHLRSKLRESVGTSRYRMSCKSLSKLHTEIV